jgi:hypothetical protein
MDRESRITERNDHVGCWTTYGRFLILGEQTDALLLSFISIFVNILFWIRMHPPVIWRFNLVVSRSGETIHVRPSIWSGFGNFHFFFPFYSATNLCHIYWVGFLVTLSWTIYNMCELFLEISTKFMDYYSHEYRTFHLWRSLTCLELASRHKEVI